jgi:hypothetical protein
MLSPVVSQTPVRPAISQFVPVSVCPPGTQDYDKEEQLTKQVNFKDRNGGMPRLRVEIPITMMGGPGTWNL